MKENHSSFIRAAEEAASLHVSTVLSFFDQLNNNSKYRLPISTPFLMMLASTLLDLETAMDGSCGELNPQIPEEVKHTASNESEYRYLRAQWVAASLLTDDCRIVPEFSPEALKHLTHGVEYPKALILRHLHREP